MPEIESISLSRVCRGERQAWNDFVVVVGPLLRGIVWRLLSRAGRGDDTADVLQEVFVRLVRDDFRLLRQYDPARAALGTWLGVVASSTAIDWLRKATPALVALDDVPEDQLPRAQPAPDDPAMIVPPNLLSPREALVLKLLYEDDLDVSEVAARLRVQAQTVRSLRHKAVSRLRRLLVGRCDQG